MEQLIGAQLELQIQMSKQLANFKKAPKDRLTEIFVKIKLQLLEESWKYFSDNHAQILNIPRPEIKDTPYKQDDVYAECEETYTEAKCLMLEKLSKFTISQPVAQESSSHRPQTEIKLPRITIPKFSGSYLEWAPFHDLYISLIHDNAALTKVQKLHYLKSNLSGEAEVFLRNVPITEVNYDSAWASLKKRFNNKRFIVTAIMKRLMAQKSCSMESSASLKNLLDTTTECLSGLENLNIKTENWDVFLNFTIAGKLDTESAKLWEQHITNIKIPKDELPTFKQLSEFLEARFREMEMLESNNQNQASTSKISKQQFAVPAVSMITCSFCNGDHYIFHCKDFARLSLTDRKSFVEENALCYNCLNPNHMLAMCKQTTVCRKCGKRHHTLIHHERINTWNSDNQEVAKQVNNVTAHFAEEEKLNKQVLLATAIVKVANTNGATHLIRALIDQGSQGSFITESATQLLGLTKIPMSCSISGLGQTENLKSKYMVELELQSRHDPTFKTPVRAIVLKKLTSLLPADQITEKNWPHLHQLPLADHNFNKPGKVDLLLGAEIHGEILLDGLKKGPQGTPIAQHTRLGWIVSGQLYNEKTTQSYVTTKTINMHLQIDDNDFLKRFWEIESDNACTTKKVLSEEEKKCEDHYKNTHYRDETGRYVVSLPFKTKDPICQYGSSREVAVRRLLQLERRLNKEPLLKKAYADVLHEYLTLDHMVPVTKDNDRHKPTAVYLPHHAVVREDKATSKVRIVFDASCRYRNGASLNQTLMVGPTLQQDLRHIIMRWRTHKIVLISDVTKMYRQVRVTEDSADYQRILWRDDSNEEIKDYKNTRVTFGTASAPYLATKTLQQLALDEKEKHLIASEITLRDFYVDDLLTGGDSLEDGKRIYHDVSDLMNSGGFPMAKWNSNNTELLRYMQASENIEEHEMITEATVKTLGLIWNNMNDEFGYKITLPETPIVITKRSILSDISKLFDPMGWLSPTIVLGKMLIQRLWLTGVTWDQEVSPSIKSDWLKFRLELKHLSEIKISRWLSTNTTGTKMELYGYADASTTAYAAVVYCRVIDTEGNVTIQLISSKTKVAPIKTISVPRLELCGAVLLAKLLTEVAEILAVAKKDLYAYTDSKVVLDWLQSHPSKWKTFVANRTSEILTTLPSEHWNHVKTTENPADVASRGISAPLLKEKDLWWQGPKWLHDKEINHDKYSEGDITVLEIKPDKNTMFVMTTQIDENFWSIFSKFSSLLTLMRVVAYCKRVFNTNKQDLPNYLTANEISNARTVCLLACQEQEFFEDISRLRENKPVKKQSKLRALDPYLDEKGILRVGGRISRANLPEETKHQIVLPCNHDLSKLIVAEAHTKTLHGGPTLMMSYLRQKHWIIGGKGMVNREVHRCITCIRQRASTRTQIMASLPEQRVTPSRPFLHSAVDYAGPINFRMSKGRGCKTYKGYIAIFICMVTKAIHIEIVASLESEAFVAAFKRFTARRGHCAHMWSDNGTNFVAGNKMLHQMLDGSLTNVKAEIAEKLANDGTTWHFIPAGAPHFGGLWEAGVRSIKFHLKRILGNSTLTYEEMATATSQIEACLNSRPISPISDDVNDLLPLTPGHFLIGEPPIVVPEESYVDYNTNRLNRWQLVQRMIQHFWSRWSSEYLTRLQQRPKWTKRVDNALKEGDLVLVKDENLPPGKWPLARITDLHPGADGLVRVVTIKMKNTIVKRPITKICPLSI